MFIDALNGCATSRHQFHQLKAHVPQLTAQSGEASDKVQSSVRDNVVPLTKVATETKTPDQNEIRKVFQAIPPGINAETWVKGRSYYTSGLTGPSQRADAIFCMGHYLFYGDPANHLPALGYGLEQERKHVIEINLSERHYGNSRDLNRDRADEMKQVERATAWLPQSRSKANKQPSKFEMPISWIRHNTNLKIDARARITAAVKILVAAGAPFSSRDLSDKAKCSRATLYKHLDLWKAAYDELHNFLFASGPHVYNAVDQVVSLETLSPVSVEKADSELTDFFQEDAQHQDDLEYRRTTKVVNSWIAPILRLLPQELNSVDTSRLLFLIPTIAWFVSAAPSVSCKRWLESRLEAVRLILEKRVIDFHLVHENAISPLRFDMFNRYLRIFGRRPLVIARRLSDSRNFSGRGKHPPPS